MDVRQWLHERRPTPPATLLARLEEALGREVDDDAQSVVATSIDAAAALLTDVVARPDAGRECALDLLTVDALATYAFEAASESPDDLVAQAHRALRRFAAVGADHGSGS